MILKTFFLLLIFVFVCYAKKGVRFDKFEACGRTDPDRPLKFHNLTLLFSPEIGHFVNLTMEIKEDLISEKLWGSTRMDRCANKEVLDSCEYYGSLKPPSICALISMGGIFFSKFVDQFSPPLRCPLKKGFYYGYSVTFDPNLFKVFPVDGYYWKGNGSIFEGERYLGSLCVEGSVVKLRD